MTYCMFLHSTPIMSMAPESPWHHWICVFYKNPLPSCIVGLYTEATNKLHTNTHYMHFGEKEFFPHPLSTTRSLLLPLCKLTCHRFCLMTITLPSWQVYPATNLSWQISMQLSTSGQVLLAGLCLCNYCKHHHCHWLRHCSCTFPTAVTIGHPNQAPTTKPAFTPATFLITSTGTNPWLLRPQLTKIYCTHSSWSIIVWVFVAVPNGAS